ncbi:hypothetical protein B0T09DRAFT_346523 [Sordaria sp. MPI-SDFR-AT-0083]|nr:hypothetical protein B0T09DRAFT_346523 [Sordaria sp. MPI-SDFR-AT-0083]
MDGAGRSYSSSSSSCSLCSFFFSLYFPPCLLFIFFALLHTATTRYKGGWTWSLGWMLASVGPLVVAIWSFFL